MTLFRMLTIYSKPATTVQEPSPTSSSGSGNAMNTSAKRASDPSASQSSIVIGPDTVVPQLKRKRTDYPSPPSRHCPLVGSTSPTAGPVQKRVRQININSRKYPSNVGFVSVCNRCQSVGKNVSQPRQFAAFLPGDENANRRFISSLFRSR